MTREEVEFLKACHIVKDDAWFNGNISQRFALKDFCVKVSNRT